MKLLKYFILILTLGVTSCIIEKTTDVKTDINTIENGLLPSVRIKGDSIIKYTILERMEHYNVPGVSIALVENGKIKWAKGYGIANTNNGNKVDTNTIFQAASISKPLAALSALKLVEEGILNLDKDVNEFLKGWQIPNSGLTKDEKVTLRRLLTHTGGMTVHGFPGYKQTDTLPTITQILNGKGNTPRIFVDAIPGSIWRYSGGGYLIVEKIVEDVSGLPLEIYMAKNILRPIGMKNSTFEQPLGTEYQSNASAAYDSEGKIIDGLWHNYPEQSAAGLWTTPTDLAKYCIEITEIINGKENALLSKETIDEMLTKHKNNWGLGPSLQWEKDSLIFRHSGKNAGFTNNLISFAIRGNALIVMTNADKGGQLIPEIERAVSDYYKWGINEQKVVEIIRASPDTLIKYVGKYQLENSKIMFDFQLVENQLFAKGPSRSFQFLAMTSSKFIELETGNEIEFQVEGEKTSFIWNGKARFNKKQK